MNTSFKLNGYSLRQLMVLSLNVDEKNLLNLSLSY
jgi:hypothetical protein